MRILFSSAPPVIFLLVAAAPLAQSAATPTYSKDVAPILNKNCAGCHRPGEIAPMSLLTYEDARPWAKAIRSVVALGAMPPWHADAPRGTFSNDRRLTDQEKQTLIAWVDGGSPQGDPKDLPPAPKFVEGWEIGRPDAVISMQQPFDVPASGTINYQYFQIPTNFTEDKWVQAIEVKPGTRAVVHHILVFAKEPGGAIPESVFTTVVPKPPVPKDGKKPLDPGEATARMRGVLIATTAPGTNAMMFQPGSAVLIKAGSILTFQVHYTANGTSASDVSSVGFIFAKEPPQHEVYNSAFLNATFVLEPGEANKAVDCNIEFKENVHITALFPHTHLRGKSWEYRMVYPDGRSEIVLSVPKYDFNWQTYYVFTTPLAVPKGSRLEATAHYDNSVNNAANPDPTKTVRWGEQTWQEMQYSGITYTVDDPSSQTTARK
jgi:mono/diheme cytochrome c family protein